MTKDHSHPLGHTAVDALFTAGGETVEDRLARDLQRRFDDNYETAEAGLIRRLAQRGKSSNEIERYRATMAAHHQRVVDLLESAIERLMLPWLISMRVDRLRLDMIRTTRPTDDEYARPYDLRIVPQLSLGRYRLDFAIVLQVPDRSLIVALECDGSEFHRVPDDAVRDRYLASFGVATVRASGADINRSAEHVSHNVILALETWLDGKLRLAR